MFDQGQYNSSLYRPWFDINTLGGISWVARSVMLGHSWLKFAILEQKSGNFVKNWEKQLHDSIIWIKILAKFYQEKWFYLGSGV